MQQAEGRGKLELPRYAAGGSLDSAWMGRVGEMGSVPGRVPWLETTNDRVTDQGLDGIMGGAIPEQGPHRLSLSVVAPNAAQWPAMSRWRSDDRRESQTENHAEEIGALAHDARNMLLALDLYCDLLDEPGVLCAPFRHYAGELRLVAGASRRLVEKLALLECGEHRHGNQKVHEREPEQAGLEQVGPTLVSMSAARPYVRSYAQYRFSEKAELPIANWPRFARRQILHAVRPIESMAEELLANQNLLSALAGPGITLGVSIAGGQSPVAMTGDDLTRVLVNLVKNAAEAMPAGGHIQIVLEQARGLLRLSVADTGCGIPPEALDTIFVSGYSTHVDLDANGDEEAGLGDEVWPSHRRGLGLAIVRSIVTAAGGTVRAANRAGHQDISAKETNRNADSDGGLHVGSSGAVFLLEFPAPV